MKKKLWFKAKCYGWGWYPSTWQGWLAILIWLVLILLWIFLFNTYYSIEANIWEYLLGIFILTAILILFCWRTGEKPRWRWGK
ncbi:Uncharacterised protein [uncultured archaeon]|nr:Uncharacterised protein [uncultured archaeon]